MKQIRNHTVESTDAGGDAPDLVCQDCGLGADSDARFEQITCSGGDA